MAINVCTQIKVLHTSSSVTSTNTVFYWSLECLWYEMKLVWWDGYWCWCNY